MTTIEREDIKAAVRITWALADAIKEAGRMPSGHLYAAVCGHMSLGMYQSVIGLLKRNGIIREEAHELIWVGVPIVAPEGPVS